MDKIKETLKFYADDSTYDSRNGIAIFKDSGDKAKGQLRRIARIAREYEEAKAENTELKQEILTKVEHLQVENGKLQVELNKRDRKIRQAAKMLTSGATKKHVIEFLNKK